MLVDKDWNAVELSGSERGELMGRSGFQGTPWHEEIKYDDTTLKKVSCRDCKFYDKDDNLCFKGVDIKAAGY